MFSYFYENTLKSQFYHHVSLLFTFVSKKKKKLLSMPFMTSSKLLIKKMRLILYKIRGLSFVSLHEKLFLFSVIK